MRRNFATFILWPIYFLCFFGIQYLSDWWLLRVSGIRGGNFTDLSAVLRWSDCYPKVGSAVYDVADGKCSGYFYGSALLRAFNLLGINAAQTKFWGIVGGVIFCISLGFLAAFLVSRKAVNPIVVGLTLSSPPLWLLIERGNIDVLIFLLVLISSFLLFRGFDLIAIAIITITALFKFYTLPILLILALTSRTKKSRVIALVAFLVVVPFIAIDLFKFQSGFPSTWFLSFGVPSIGFWINLIGENLGLSWLHIGAPAGHVFGLVVYAASIAILKIFTDRSSKNLLVLDYQKTDKKGIDTLLLILGSVFVICYLLGMNFDYRLIFVAIAGLALVGQTQQSSLRKNLQYLLITALWLSCFSFGLQHLSYFFYLLIQFIGDIALGIFTAFLSLRLVSIIKRLARNLLDAFD